MFERIPAAFMIDEALFGKCDMPEFIGCTLLDTIGLLIPSVSPALHKEIGLPADVHALGLISSRTGAAGQILACDEAVKMTNTRVISVELPRDTKGWGGHGNYIVMGGETVDDARSAVEQALRLIERNAGEVYISDAGHLEFAYSARAGQALHMAFGAPEKRAFGFMAASPAAIGMVIADRALKSSGVELITYMSPSRKTSHSNEVIIAFTGDAADVKNAVLTGRECGMKLLTAMGSLPLSPGKPYIE